MANRFTRKAQQVLQIAMQVASDLGHTYIGSEHLLLALTSEDSGVAAQCLAERGASAERIRDAIVERSGEGSPTDVSAADLTPRTKHIIENSLSESDRYGQNYLGTEHLLLSLLEERDCVAVAILEETGVSVNDLRQDLITFLTTGGSGDSVGGRRPGYGGASATDGASGSGKGMESCPTLKNFGRNLTELAKSGKMDPIIGRENETERVIQILSRRTKNNPCLIGEPGVGKTAVVEGLAQRIVAGKVPENLRDKVIVSLDLAAMLAGAKYRGEFEERFKSVMDEVRKNPNLSLIHI